MAASKPTYAIISSCSVDRLINGYTGAIIKDQPGGPGLHLAAAFKTLDIIPKMYSQDDILVKIRVFEDDEFGSTEFSKPPKGFPTLTEDAAIFSTILREWSLKEIHDYKGKLFMDIQGYVRDGTDYGKKVMWDNARNYIDTIFCLKGNEVEMQYIPHDVLLDQRRNRMLITTHGKKGVTIAYRGKEIYIAPFTIAAPKNTIGAGDTFLASFVAKYMQTEDISTSGAFAVERTTAFLKAKR